MESLLCTTVVCTANRSGIAWHPRARVKGLPMAELISKQRAALRARAHALNRWFKWGTRASPKQ